MQTATRLPRRITTALPLLAAVLAAMPAQTHAANGTWTGDGTVGDDGFTVDSLWSNAGNWSGGVPGTGDTATFGSGPSNLTVNSTGVTVQNLAFTGTAPTYSFSDGTSATGLTLGSAGMISMASGAAAQTLGSVTAANSATITNNSSNLLTLGGLTGSQAGQTLTFDGSGPITVNGGQMAAAGNTTQIIKNGSGTLTLNNGSQANVQGGLTVNAGTVVGTDANSFSNRQVTLGAGTTLQMNRSGAGSQFGNGTPATGIAVNGDSTLFYNQTGSQWRIGKTGAPYGFLTSSNQPTLTITTAAAAAGQSANIQSYLDSSGFDGTVKLGDNGAFAVNASVAAGGANFRLNMGDAASSGKHHFMTGTILAVEGATQSTIPVVLGALSGTNAGSILAGRQNTGTRTTGTSYLVGGLGTSTAYAGTISDGISTTGAAQSNGNADATNGATTYGRNAGIAGSQGTTELVKTGAGTLTLTGANSHTGGTVIKGGRLAVNSDAALGAAYTGSLRPFAVIPGTGVYNNTSLPTVSITGGGTPSQAATAGLFSSQFGSNGNSNLFLSFSNQNANTEAGNITSTLTGAGYTSVPTITVNTDGVQSTAGSLPLLEVRVQGLLTLDGGTLQTDAGITSDRAVVVGAAGGTIDTNGFDSTFSGVINGSGDLTKTGNGTLTLTGNNTLTGLTTVAGGVLNLEGTLAGSVTVNAGASLAGDGTAGSATILGTIAPGNSIGQLNFGGATSLSGTAMIELDAAGAPNADLINVAGAVTLGGDLTVSWLSAPAAGTYNIIDATSFSGSFANVNLPALTGSLTWDTSQLNTAGILTVVPEPGIGLLTLLGSTLLLRRRRR